MIIVDKISQASINFYKVIARFGLELYVYDYEEIEQEYTFKNGFIKKIEFKAKDKSKISSLNYIKYYGENPYIRYLPISFSSNLNNKFLNIKRLREKLIHIIEDLFWSLETNTILSFISNHSNPNNKSHIIIHHNLYNYLFNCRKKEFRDNITNLYSPIDDINKIRFIISKIFKRLFKKIFIKDIHSKKNNPETTQRNYKVGVIFHDSIVFGKNLYNKEHFYSKDPNNPLNKQNTINFVSGGIRNSTNNQLITLNPNQLPIRTKINIYFESFLLFLKNLKFCKNRIQLKGNLICAIIFIRYKYWLNYFSNYNIDNIIYDFDINFSKALALALESLNINTIAICERPNHLMLNGLGVIVKNYLVPGLIYKKYAETNDSFIFDNLYVIDFWKTKYFDEFKNKKIKKSHYFNINNQDKEIKSFRGKILILGWFLKITKAHCFINEEANKKFFQIIDQISETFKEFAIMVRMKNLDIEDEKIISKRFTSKKNIFLCNNYETLGLSYLLCKEADLIISLPTSIAEESLAYGKKVIFLDDLYTINKISSGTYPKEYIFAIAKNIKQLKLLSKKILSNEPSIIKKYKILSNQLNLSKSQKINYKLIDLIESLLK